MKIINLIPFIFFLWFVSESMGARRIIDIFQNGEANIDLQLAFYDRNEIVRYELYRSEEGTYLHRKNVPWHWDQQKTISIDMRDSEKTEIDPEAFGEILNTLLDQRFLESVSRLTNVNMSNVFGSITVEKGGLQLSIPAVGWVMLEGHKTHPNSIGSDEDTLPAIEEPPPPTGKVTDGTELKIQSVVDRILRLAGDWDDAPEIEQNAAANCAPAPES